MKKRMVAMMIAAMTALAPMASMAAETENETETAAVSEEAESESETEAQKIDLTGMLIGVQLGTTGDLSVTDEYGDENIERYNKGFEAVQALSQGKIDAVVIDELPAQEFVEATEGLTILDGAYSEEEYAICFKKGNTELAEKVNEAIKELKEEGTFEQIANSYIGDKAGENFYESPEDTDRSNGSLVMATNAEFPPYEYYEGNEIIGLDVDFAQAICDKLGMELEVEDMAFDSIVPAVVSGKADMGVAGITVSEDRKEQVDFSEGYYTSKQVIIVTEETAKELQAAE
jgi:ABC-type amino acid transport substrate-binding protein